MKVTVLNNQSLIDIAIQTTGKAENFLQIAMDNNLVPTDPIEPGTVLSISNTVEAETNITQYFDKRQIHPTSGLTKALEDTVVDLTCEEKLYNCFKE